MPFSRPSFLFSVQQWIQEFPDRGANPQAWGKDPLFCRIFAENFIKMKESAPRGSRVPSAPLESVNDVDRPLTFELRLGNAVAKIKSAT